MTRLHIEFLPSQGLPWRPAPAELGGPRAEWKVLSEDDASGAVTALARWPAGFAPALGALAVDLEVFVLQGTLDAGAGLSVPTHGYVYLPAGWPLGAVATTHGAVALVFANAPLAPASADLVADSTRLVAPVDTRLLHWSESAVDPRLAYLRATRKDLRFEPDGLSRSYLLAAPPHGFPKEGLPKARHPHAMECFLIAGDLATDHGVMRPGAYVWRPPGAQYGPTCTQGGFLMFCRTPGAESTVVEWDDRPERASWTPVHAPQLPPGLPPTCYPPLPETVEY